MGPKDKTLLARLKNIRLKSVEGDVDIDATALLLSMDADLLEEAMTRLFTDLDVDRHNFEETNEGF